VIFSGAPRAFGPGVRSAALPVALRLSSGLFIDRHKTHLRMVGQEARPDRVQGPGG